MHLRVAISNNHLQSQKQDKDTRHEHEILQTHRHLGLEGGKKGYRHEENYGKKYLSITTYAMDADGFI